MANKYSHNISVVLDQRREKGNGKFPVKLRVYSKNLKRAKLYNTDVDLSQSEFDVIWTNSNSNNVRGKNRDVRTYLLKFETKANDEAEKLGLFSFEGFENKLFRKSSDANNIIYHYSKLIQENISKGKIGTSENFKYSLKSISDFLNYKAGKELKKIPFETFTVDCLEAYEHYMLSKGKSVTSVGIYIRPLRIVFNNAIESNDISKEIYPFGKRKYQIPKSKKVKKALNSDDLKILYNAKPITLEQEKAKDFWFFSYSTNGMNLKDVALLKYSDIRDEEFSYYRAKTFGKSHVKSKIVIHLNDYTKKIIEKYSTRNKDGFVFDILNSNDSDETQYKKIKNFTRFINQHIKKLAEANNITSEISTYWARHSFATNSIRKGATKEFISDALNHSSMDVTDNYFAGFEDEIKKEFANSLMDF
jgi:site-specific recombinase XerD